MFNCLDPGPHLAEDDGHEEEVEQERLGQVGAVEGEEEDGEENGGVLVGGAAVGGAQQLEARHRDHQSAQPAAGSDTTHRNVNGGVKIKV